MYLETLPHFRLGATLVCQPFCEPLACVRGENEDGNFDVRGSADVKHNVYSESWSFMGQHTHHFSSTQFWPRAQRSISLGSFHVGWHTLRYWVVCVSWKSFCNAHPPCHGLRNPIHTVHVQMIFLHATAWRSNPIPNTLYSATEHTLFPKLPPYICIPPKMFLHFRELLENGSLQRSPP